MRKRLSPGVILGVFAVVLACTGSAAAGSLITSGSIKDGTIRGRDIHKGTITSDPMDGSTPCGTAKSKHSSSGTSSATRTRFTGS